MGVVQWWNVAEGAKPKYPQKNLSQSHFVRYKPYTHTGLGSNLGLSVDRPKTASVMARKALLFARNKIKTCLRTAIQPGLHLVCIRRSPWAVIRRDGKGTNTEQGQAVSTFSSLSLVSPALPRIPSRSILRDILLPGTPTGSHATPFFSASHYVRAARLSARLYSRASTDLLPQNSASGQHSVLSASSDLYNPQQ
jgi:hypothetical protein